MYGWHITRFPIGSGRTVEDYANDLFAGKTYEFPPQAEGGEPQIIRDTVVASYQTREGLTVQLFTQPPTESGITLSVQMLKLGNPLLGQPSPMTTQEAQIVENNLNQFKQNIETQ